MLGLAICSYRYIETPLRKGNWFGKRWKTIVVGGGVIVTVSGGLIALGKPLKGQLYTGRIIQTVNPTFLEGEECLENISKETKCYFIDNKSKQTLWMLGDSHTKSLALAGKEVANSLGMNLKLYLAPATTFPPVSKYLKVLKKENLKKVDDFKFVEKQLYREIKFGDVILLSMRMPYHFGGTYYEKTPSANSQENYFNEWITSVENLANIAYKQGAKVIIQTPIPEWEEELNNSCTKNEWFNISQKRNCQIESKFFIDEETGIYRHLLEKLNRLSSSHQNIYLFDTYKIVCPESTCSFIKNGFEIYRDNNHLSFGWARDFLAPKMSKFINEIQTMDK